MSVYGYARVSTSRQADGESLTVQTRQLEGYALQHGFKIEAVLLEEGISGSVPLQTRPVGGPLLDLLGPGDVLIAAKLDRLFRSAADALVTAEMLKKRGVALHLLDLGGDITGGGMAKFFFTMVAAFAEAERDRIKERIGASKKHQKVQGRFMGGQRAPFGYAVDDKGNLVEDSREQQAVRHAVKLRKQGASLRKIRDAITDKGFKIDHMGVKRLLRRAGAYGGVNAA